MRSSMPQKLSALLLVLVLSCSLAACSQQQSATSVSSSGSQDNRPKLIVYLVGFGEQLSIQDANGYGYEKTFYQNGIQPFLSSNMKNVTSMVYSYSENDGTGKPQPFTCADTYNHSLLEDINNLQTQINSYIQQPKHANTEVYLVGHSLGGLVAFSYTIHLIESSRPNALPNDSELKGLAVLDSPINGVTRANNYQNTLIGWAYTCTSAKDYTIVSQMQTLGDTGQFNGDKASLLGTLLQGKFIPNQQAAQDAANAGITILIVGNIKDILWQPNVCLLGPNFLSTQYLSEKGKIGNGALYVRSFSQGRLGCTSIIVGANHGYVTTSMDVQKAILEVFTGQSPDVLTTSVTQNSMPTGILTPTQPTYNFSPFVGTWGAHSRFLTIKADGSATLTGRVFVVCGPGVSDPCDNPPMGDMNTGITFTRVSADGKTVYGTVTSGNGDRNHNIDPPNNVLPIGSLVSGTLEADDKGNYTLLNMSDGFLLCSDKISPTDQNYGDDCMSGA